MLSVTVCYSTHWYVAIHGAEDAGMEFFNIVLPIPSMYAHARKCAEEGKVFPVNVVEW
jgi:hypothetical protein